jgi:hypothetical protein
MSAECAPDGHTICRLIEGVELPGETLRHALPGSVNI